jgi:hypothetical protein
MLCSVGLCLPFHMRGGQVFLLRGNKEESHGCSVFCQHEHKFILFFFL